MTLQKIPDADVVRLFSLVKLDDVRVFTETSFKTFQQKVDGLRHVLGVLPVDGYRKGVPAQDLDSCQYPSVTFVLVSVLSHFYQVQLCLVREVFTKVFRYLCFLTMGLYLVYVS